MPKSNYVIADVFTINPLEGNPVAVFIDAKDIEARDMQRLARELNLSETTFVLPAKQGGDFHVRIFTPVNELPFAGHPTLGTSIVLGEITNKHELRLETAKGIIPFKFKRAANGKIIESEMLQPIPSWQPYEHADLVLQALNINSSTLPIEIYTIGPRHVFVGLKTIESLSAIKPDLRILSTLPDVAINCFAGEDSQWRMRMFSPAYGVAEDAATGSAAGPLALHLARHGYISFGQTINIHQGVEMGKKSLMKAKAVGNLNKVESLTVSGSAVIVAHGEFICWSDNHEL